MTMDTIDTIQPAGVQPQPASNSPSLKTMLASGWRLLRGWHEKRESRRTLRDLTDDQLSDIGITRREARTEVGKSFFWD